MVSTALHRAILKRVAIFGNFERHLKFPATFGRLLLGTLTCLGRRCNFPFRKRSLPLTIPNSRYHPMPHRMSGNRGLNATRGRLHAAPRVFSFLWLFNCDIVWFVIVESMPNSLEKQSIKPSSHISAMVGDDRRWYQNDRRKQTSMFSAIWSPMIADHRRYNS